MDAEPEVETRERESRVVVKLPMTATTTLMAPLTEKKKGKHRERRCKLRTHREEPS
jgi:hypothetical protein